MTYELGQELEKARFPFFQACRDNCGPHDKNCLPTLSELIEACGEGFHALEKYKNRWTASGCHFPEINDTELVEGPTPEEAVSKLWLALQVKEQK